MKTYIIGAGGVGGYYCGLMAQAGADVTLVCRPTVSALLRSQGLAINDRDRQFQTKEFGVVDSIAEISQPELILLAVKTYHLEEVAAQLTSVASPATIIITLQNGINADELVAKHLTQSKIFPGLTWVLSTLVRPGHVEQKAPRTFIKFGSRSHADNEALSRAGNFLQASGVPVQISDNITRDLWEKFIWLVNFAGMAGLRRKAIGLIVNDPKDYQLWVQALDESLAVARALSIPLDSTLRDFVMERLKSYQTTNTDFKPSLLKDLEKGRRTEIEALSGTLLKLASQTGVETPVHKKFFEAITAT